MQLKSIYVVAVAGLMLAACAKPPAQTAAPKKPAVDTAAIRQLGEARLEALAAKNTDTYLGAYAEDAIWMPPNADSIIGKAAAKARLEGSLKDVTFSVSQKTEEQLVAGDECVIERGTFIATRTEKDGKETAPVVGSYLSVWKKQADGQWKIVYDIWNNNRGAEATR